MCANVQQSNILPMQVISQIDTKKVILINYQEFAGFYNYPVFINQLINVDTSVKFFILNIYCKNRGEIFCFIYAFTNRIEYLHRIKPAVGFLKFKIYHSICGIGIGSYKLSLYTCIISGRLVLSKRCKSYSN